MAAASGAKFIRWQSGLLKSCLLIAFFSVAQASEFAVPGEQEPLNVATTARPSAFQWDPKGYVVFCLCMGECVEGLVEHAAGATPMRGCVVLYEILVQIMVEA